MSLPLPKDIKDWHALLVLIPLFIGFAVALNCDPPVPVDRSEGMYSENPDFLEDP